MKHSVLTALTTCGSESVEMMMMSTFIAHDSINLMLSALKEGKGVGAGGWIERKS